jgi:hypothetical protein
MPTTEPQKDRITQENQHLADHDRQEDSDHFT